MRFDLSYIGIMCFTDASRKKADINIAEDGFITGTECNRV